MELIPTLKTKNDFVYLPIHDFYVKLMKRNFIISNKYANLVFKYSI